MANRQNSRVIVSSPHDVPPLFTSKNSKAVMVLGAFASVKIDVKVKVQSDGHVMHVMIYP